MSCSHFWTLVNRIDAKTMRREYIGHTCLRCGSHERFPDGKPPGAAPLPAIPKAPSITEADVPY